jgi:hypothetical protein
MSSGDSEMDTTVHQVSVSNDADAKYDGRQQRWMADSPLFVSLAEAERYSDRMKAISDLYETRITTAVVCAGPLSTRLDTVVSRVYCMLATSYTLNTLNLITAVVVTAIWRGGRVRVKRGSDVSK